MALPWIRDEDGDLVLEFVKDKIALDLVDSFTRKVGAIVQTKAGMDFQPIHSRRWTIASEMRRLAHDLGLTPQARRSLNLDQTIDVMPLSQRLKEMEDGQAD